MKKLLSLTALASLLAVTGCVTNQTNGKKELDPAVAQSIAFDVAAIGGSALKAQYPTELDLTYKALDALVSAGSGDVIALQTALGNLPVGVLQGTNSALIQSGSAIVISQGVSVLLSLDKSQAGSKYVLPIARGLRDGLKQALGKQASAGTGFQVQDVVVRDLLYRPDRDGPAIATFPIWWETNKATATW